MNEKKIIGLEALKKYDQHIKDFIRVKGDSAVKLVLVSVNETEQIENCPIGGEFCFYSTRTFNSLRDVCSFISEYCNNIAHQGYPMHFSGSVGTEYLTNVSSIVAFDDSVIYIDGREILISEVEDALADYPNDFFVKYFDI